LAISIGFLRKTLAAAIAQFNDKSAPVCSGAGEKSTLGNSTPSKAGVLDNLSSISFFSYANIVI
jgi:hypothetical protein